jgi:protein RecA
MAKTEAVKSLADLQSKVFKNVAAPNMGVKYWLDTGFKPLNKAISGDYAKGIPSGRMIEIFGKESCGKTAIATSAMINAQKEGGIAIFLDHERSFIPQLGEKMGLCIDPAIGNFVHQTPRTFEEAMDLTIEYIESVRVNKLIPEEAPIVIVFDSLAAMIPKSKFVKKVEEQGMHDSLALAKACSSAFPLLQAYADDFNATMLFLNQTRTNPAMMFGDSTTTPGGDAKNFYYSVRIGLTRKMIKDKDKNTIGQTIKAKVIKNKVNKPFSECEWQFTFRDDGTGFLDSLSSSIDYLIARGDIIQSGAYVEFNGKKVFRSKFTELIIENKLEQTIYDMF